METPFHRDPLEFTIKKEEDGTLVASNPLTTLMVLKYGETTIKKRRAIKTKQDQPPEFKSMLFAELDGVRLYIQGNNLILTKRDLYL